jgi:hypothetical protein
MKIKPEDLREDLEEKASGAPTDNVSAAAGAVIAAQGGVTAAGVTALDVCRDDIIKNISASYFFLRRGMAIMALAFPIALWAIAGIHDLQQSISAYYHFHVLTEGPHAYGTGTARNVFVGVLWAIGSFLFFYKGYSKKEDYALDIAGLAAVLIALFPMDWPGRPPSWNNIVHFTSAILFFLSIAFVCISCSNDTLNEMKDDTRRRWFKRIYRILGTLMVVLPVSLFVLHVLSGRLEDKAHATYVVLGIEVAAIWIFAIFWLFKSREIAILEKQGPKGSAA